jgi:hypothetical protein
VILLTDGWSNGSDNSDIADELRAEGITLSPWRRAVDRLRTGRISGTWRRTLLPRANMEDVPQIFVEETIKTVGSYIIEEPFVPTLAGDSAILRGLTDVGWPSLYGYNGTQIKSSAQLILQSPQGDPVLAQWQYGWDAPWRGRRTPKGNGAEIWCSGISSVRLQRSL